MKKNNHNLKNRKLNNKNNNRRKIKKIEYQRIIKQMNQKLMDYMDLHKFYKITQMMIINRMIELKEEIK